MIPFHQLVSVLHRDRCHQSIHFPDDEQVYVFARSVEARNAEALRDVQFASGGLAVKEKGSAEP